MSVLAGAKNITINNGTFTAVSTTVTSNVNANDIVALLHSQSATAGLLDAKERFDSPKCDEGTRVAMILGMKKFVQDGNAASSPALYWLYGPAGVGKSALAQSLSVNLKDGGDHAASFFFSRTSPGRSNGNQLIVTLAYQLAMAFPALQPFISKVFRTNPGITTASNAVQMQSLIIDPINKWRKKYNWSIQWWMDWLFNRKPHPRLILVDGLDECSDPNVQTDLILCIASAVRQLKTPFRFVVISRLEAHILTTFEFNSAFQGRDGVAVTKKNLGDDEDVDEQITRYLVKEFAEIRKTHPIREFLPQQWPRPNQVERLVAKASKGFIYPTTVVRYIKMPRNRPDECLDRILGLSEIPKSDKPYEPLDALYGHVFESVPEPNQTSILNIFHFLVVPSTWKGVTDPRVIEKHFEYPHGHVRHVLGDLLCLVELIPNGSIKVLHASLPDFLLDESRSGPQLRIDARNAHATIAGGYLLSIRSGNELPSPDKDFTNFLDHLMHANMSDPLLCARIMQMNLLPRYTNCQPVILHKRYIDLNGQVAGIGYMIAYLLILVIRHGPESYIKDQIAAIKAYILELYPVVGDVHMVNEQIIPVMIPLFRKWTSKTFDKSTKDIFAYEITPSQNDLWEAVFELHFLMMVRLCQENIKHLGPKYSEKKQTELTEQLERQPTRGPNFWANIVKGIENSFHIIPEIQEESS